MDASTAQTAAAAASILAPFMPYLVEAGKKFASKAGEAAYDKAAELWKKITRHAGADPKLKGAALVVSADPKDPDAQALLAKALAAKMEENPALLEDVLAAVGGAGGVQEIVASGGSWIEDAVQQMTGGGEQSIKARDDSVIKGVRQVKR